MVVVCFNAYLAKLPPLYSLLQTLKARGEEVWYLGLFESNETRKLLDKLEINYRLMGYRLSLSYKRYPFTRAWRILSKPLRHIIFRRWYWREIDKITDGRTDVVLWSIAMTTAAVLGDRALKFGRRHIHTFYELGDDIERPISGFNKQVFYDAATIVECEKHRAEILKQEQHLRNLPFVIPNKPYSHPRTRDIPISDPAAAAVVKDWGNRQVFLYQGVIQEDRVDLITLIPWLCEAFPECIIAVMSSRNAIVERFERTYKNFRHVPFVQPPHHLEVTSHATIGLAAYTKKVVWGLHPLNSVYCAPNKTYEYCGFGIPVLCNDIAGLVESVGRACAGMCVPMESKSIVVSSARTILSDYDKFSKNASAYFDSVDLDKIVGEVLNYACR